MLTLRINSTSVVSYRLCLFVMHRRQTSLLNLFIFFVGYCTKLSVARYAVSSLYRRFLNGSWRFFTFAILQEIFNNLNLIAGFYIYWLIGSVKNGLGLKLKLNSVAWVLYRPSDRRLPAKLEPTFADRGCHKVSVKNPYGRNLGSLDRHTFTKLWISFVISSKVGKDKNFVVGSNKRNELSG
jgi:hypothetical protein